MNKVELDYLYKLSKELDSHDAAIKLLEDEKCKVKLGKDYSTHDIEAPPEVLDEIRKTLIDILIDRRQKVRMQLEAGGIKL